MTASPLESLTDKQLAAESKRLGQIISALTSEKGKAESDLRKVHEEITARSRRPPDPTLTDHALLRYIERVFGVDVDSVRQRVMNTTVIQAVKSGASAVTVDGVKFVVNTKNRAIVTVYEAPEDKKMKNFVDGKKADHVAKQMSEVRE